MKIPMTIPAGMLQPMQAGAPTATTPPPSSNDPASTIQASGAAIIEAYRRYDGIRVLAGAINNLPESAPLPGNLRIDEIAISYTLNGERKTASIKHVQRVGDVYRLLKNEIEATIDSMRANAKKAAEAAGAVEEACRGVQYTASVKNAGGIP